MKVLLLDVLQQITTCSCGSDLTGVPGDLVVSQKLGRVHLSFYDRSVCEEGETVCIFGVLPMFYLCLPIAGAPLHSLLIHKAIEVSEQSNHHQLRTKLLLLLHKSLFVVGSGFAWP